MGLTSLLLTLGACNDHDLRLPNDVSGTFGENGALLSRSDGLTIDESSSSISYIANCRVPLVGAGRMINRQANTVLSVGQYDGNVENITDLDLTNTFALSNVVGAQTLHNEIVSIIDIAHVYSGGQYAGYVLKSTSSGVLTLKLLQSFALTTYLDGEVQDQYVTTDASSLLDLGLGNINAGSATNDQSFVVEHYFEKPFNEIKLSINGIDATIANGLEIYYAFVGDNPVIPAVNDGNEYFNNGCSFAYEAQATHATGDNLVDANLKNGCTFETISGLLGTLFGGIHYSVCFGREVPAGTEVGFYVTGGSALKLSLGGTVKISSFSDDDGDALSEYTQITQVLKLGLVEGEGAYYGFVTSKPCRRVRIDFLGLNVDVGATTVHYAYVRETTKVDPSSFFALTDAIVYNPGYHLLTPDIVTDEGVTISNFKYELVSGPGEAEIRTYNKDEEYVLWNMNVPGKYVVKASYDYSYTDDYGNVISGSTEQYCTITRLVYADYVQCNYPLTNYTDENGNEVIDYEAYFPNGSWSVLNIPIGSQSGTSNNLVDEDTSNCLEITRAVDVNLISNKAIVGVKKKEGVINANGAKDLKVGFVLAYNETILNADVLKFYRIKLLDSSGEVVASGVADGAVSVDLIKVNKDNSDSETVSQIRFSITTNVEFQSIELWYTGLLDIKLDENIKIYYAFTEDYNKCDNGGGSLECLTMISNSNYGADPTVKIVGGINLVEDIHGVSNLVDGDITTYATIGQALIAGQDIEVKIKFYNSIPGNTETGFILANDFSLAKVVNVTKVTAYMNGEKVTSTNADVSIAQVKLGNGNYSFLSIVPESEFDELVLTIGKGIQLTEDLKIVGTYLRPDYDEDGIMDCITDDPITMVGELQISKEHMCSGDTPPTFTLVGGNINEYYVLQFHPYDDNGPCTKVFTVNEGLDQAYNYVSDLSYFSPWHIMKLDSDNHLVDVTSSDGETIYKNVTYFNTLKTSPGKETYSAFISNLPCGEYYVSLYRFIPTATNASTAFEFLFNRAVKLSIHPNKTTWAGVNSRDWNDWGNWDAGIPWECTDVVLPNPNKLEAGFSGTKGYPELSYGGDYRCQHIHFEAGAHLIGSEYLNHSGTVFIEMPLNVDKYQLVSAPLQAMVTGDMFVARSTSGVAWSVNGKFETVANSWLGKKWSTYNHYFADLSDGDEHKEQRYGPKMYQRFWAQPVYNEFFSRADRTLLDFTDWSRTFNHVASPYKKAQGIAVKPASEDGSSAIDNSSTVTVFFPKTYNEYHYIYVGDYTEGGTNSNVNAARENYSDYEGCFWIDYKQYGGKSDATFELLRETKYESSDTTLFVFGNPFMAQIKIKDFLEGNRGIAELHKFNGRTYQEFQSDAASSIGTTWVIEPMEAVVLRVKANSGYTENHGSVNVSNDMLTQEFGSSSTSASNSPRPSALYLQAKKSGERASCSVILGGSGSYNENEDARMLMPSMETPPVLVYTLADDYALGINSTSGNEQVPVGFYLSEPGTVELTTTAGSQWAGWTLVDSATGQRYQMNTTVTLSNVSSGSDRFYLEK